MSWTSLLALWGAALSTGLAALQLLAYRQNRAELSVSITVDLRRSEPPRVVVTVHNTGRRPTTLLKVGLLHDRTVELSRSGATFAEGQLEEALTSGPVFLDGDRVEEFGRRIGDWPWMAHADDLFRPYAIEGRSGRHVWGPALPILRLVLNGGWLPPPSTDAQLLTIAHHEVVPTRVFPRWKFWKLRDQIFAPGTAIPTRRRGYFEA